MKPGYKTLRTTAVLALNSNHLKSIEDADVLNALSSAVGANYDLERMDPKHLEALYGYFDDATAAKVLGEYEFTPCRGSIRDNGAAIAICNLCGKGDSRDDGANADHLRYEFRLSNTSGGSEVWCGSTCIINHSLKVKGAETSEEARRILMRTFQQHKAEWMRQLWRAENPDHATIPDFFTHNRYLASRVARLNSVFVGLLGVSHEQLHTEASYLVGRRGTGPLRTMARFYQRGEYLTPKKHEIWERARALDATLAKVEGALQSIQGLQGPDALFDALAGQRRKLQAA